MTELNKEEIVSRAQSLFDEGFACSQAILLTFSPLFDLSPKTAKLISSAFGGGMGRLRETCGALTGSFMVIGLAFGNEDPQDLKTKLQAYNKVRELYEQVAAVHGTTICRELLRKNTTPEQVEKRKHHKIICRKVVGDSAGFLCDILVSGLSR